MGERIEVETFGGGAAKVGGGVLAFLLRAMGLCCIGLAVLVVLFPQLVAWMVAAFFVLVGIGFLLGGRAVGRWRQQLGVFGQGFGGPFPGP